MSLTNPDKIVTEERLAEFYQTILPYLGGMPEALANKFSKSDLYSTTEKIVGQWTDGKPIYQKVVQVGTLPSSPTTAVYKTVNVGASVDNYVKIDAYASFGTGIISISYYVNTTPNWETFILPFGGNNSDASNANKVGFQYKGDMSWLVDTFIVVQYTKTTDSAISIGNDTDYSTTEKIVGTWVDGKPLYQKTVSCGALPNKTTKNVAHGITNIDYIVSIQGTSTQASGNPVIHIPYHSVNDVGGAVIAYIDNGNICLETKAADLSIYTRTYITLQYTKTTD